MTKERKQHNKEVSSIKENLKGTLFFSKHPIFIAIKNDKSYWLFYGYIFYDVPFLVVEYQKQYIFINGLKIDLVMAKPIIVGVLSFRLQIV